jgi:hypothetical protein
VALLPVDNEQPLRHRPNEQSSCFSFSSTSMAWFSRSRLPLRRNCRKVVSELDKAAPGTSSASCRKHLQLSWRPADLDTRFHPRAFHLSLLQETDFAKVRHVFASATRFVYEEHSVRIQLHWIESMLLVNYNVLLAAIEWLSICLPHRAVLTTSSFISPRLGQLILHGRHPRAF